MDKEVLHKEIDLIQGVITRMANNSFLLKGWLISLIVAVLALTKDTIVTDNIKYFALVLCLPLIIFWYLDAFFLQQERRYRKLYEWLISNRKTTNDYLYSLDSNRFEGVTDPDSQQDQEECLQDSNGNCIEDVGVLIIDDERQEKDLLLDKLKDVTDVDIIKSRIKQMFEDRNTSTKELASEFRTSSTTSSGYYEHQISSDSLRFSGSLFPNPLNNTEVRLHLHHNTESPSGRRVEQVPSDEDWWRTGLLYYQKKHFLNSSDSKDVTVLTVTDLGLFAFVIDDESEANVLGGLVTEVSSNGESNKLLSDIKRREYNKEFRNNVSRKAIKECGNCDDDAFNEKLREKLIEFINNHSGLGISLYFTPITIDLQGNITFDWVKLSN